MASTPTLTGRRRSSAAMRRGCIATTLLTLVLLAGCEQQTSQAPAEAPPPGVLVATASRMNITETFEFIGRTVAVNDVALRANVEGYLVERRFTEGDDVAQGDALFVIEPAPYEAEVAAAKGAVAEVEATLFRAKQDVARQRELLERKVASKQAMEQAEAELLQAQARLRSAKAELTKAEINLGHTIISAPVKGRIGRAFYSVGDLVTPQTDELARLVELDPIYVNFSVSEADVIRAKRENQAGGGQDDLSEIEIRLRLPDESMFDQVGYIDFIDNVVDRSTGTVIVRARFENPNKLLVPGLFVTVLLSSAITRDELLIPQAAVQESQAGKFVLVVDPDSKVEQRRITTGRAHAGAVVVRDGLQPDERVIVEGVQKVRPGITVEAKLAPMPAPGTGSQPQQEGSARDNDETKSPTAGTAKES